MIPSAEENPTGLHQRYRVTKGNGEPVDPNAVYFVLRIDALGDDSDHIKCCQIAARAYCQALFSMYPETHPLRPIANDLWSLLNIIQGKSDCPL